MKYIYAVLLTIFLGGFIFVTNSSMKESNVFSGGSMQINSYKAASDGNFVVRPYGEFEFTRPVLITCSSENPFSITGIASNVENRIDVTRIEGRYLVLGSSKVACVFVTEGGLPVAYALLPTPTMQFINIFLYSMGEICLLGVWIYVVIWKIL